MSIKIQETCLCGAVIDGDLAEVAAWREQHLECALKAARFVQRLQQGARR